MGMGEHSTLNHPIEMKKSNILGDHSMHEWHNLVDTKWNIWCTENIRKYANSKKTECSMKKKKEEIKTSRLAYNVEYDIDWPTNKRAHQLSRYFFAKQ